MLGFIAIIFVLFIWLAEGSAKHYARSWHGRHRYMEELCLRFEYFNKFVKDPENHPDPARDATGVAARDIDKKGYLPTVFTYSTWINSHEAIQQIRHGCPFFELDEEIERLSLPEKSTSSPDGMKIRNEIGIMYIVYIGIYDVEYNREEKKIEYKGEFGYAKKRDEEGLGGAKTPLLRNSKGKVDDSKWIAYCNEMEERLKNALAEYMCFVLDEIRRDRPKDLLQNYEKTYGRYEICSKEKKEKALKEEIDKISKNLFMTQKEKEKEINAVKIISDLGDPFDEALEAMNLMPIISMEYINPNKDSPSELPETK